MSYMSGRNARTGFATLITAVLTAGLCGDAVAKVHHKGRLHARSAAYESRAQVVSPAPARLGPMRYYGGPKSPMWRGPADVVFWLSSVLLTVVFGVAVGNIVRGVPLDSSGYYEGLFAWILNPYALLSGALSLVLLTMHGANWLALKTDGVVQERARRAAGRLLAVLISLTVLSALVTFLVQSRMLTNYRAKPWLIVVPLLIVAMFLVLWHARRRTDDLRAFLGSGGLIVALAGSNAVGLYPYLLPSDPHPERGLTITNAASGSGSLTMGIIWLSIGLTLVIVHTVFIYFLFRGKVLLEAGGHY